MQIPKRKLWHVDRRELNTPSQNPELEFSTDPNARQEVETDANLISSLADDGLHYPVLDLDFTAYTIPSSTPGHCHLYLNKGLEWPEFRRLLLALADAGIVEEGYAGACIERETSFVRLPWIEKQPPVAQSVEAAAGTDDLPFE